MVKTDTDFLNWFEHTKAQLWYNDKTGNWTVFLVVEDGLPIQPSGSSLRLTINKAISLWTALN